MQKYPQEDGRIGLENLDRWPSNSEAVDFLSMTTSVTSVKELSKVRIIRACFLATLWSDVSSTHFFIYIKYVYINLINSFNY